MEPVEPNPWLLLLLLLYPLVIGLFAAVFAWGDGKLRATCIKVWRFMRGWREYDEYPGCYYQWWKPAVKISKRRLR